MPFPALGLSGAGDANIANAAAGSADQVVEPIGVVGLEKIDWNGARAMDGEFISVTPGLGFTAVNALADGSVSEELVELTIHAVDALRVEKPKRLGGEFWDVKDLDVAYGLFAPAERSGHDQAFAVGLDKADDGPGDIDRFSAGEFGFIAHPKGRSNFSISSRNPRFYGPQIIGCSQPKGDPLPIRMAVTNPASPRPLLDK
jgi:hypothetical protein